MWKKIYFPGLVLGLGLMATACSAIPSSHTNGIGWSDLKFTDPVCGQITLAILDAFHIVHKPNTIPHEVWTRWACKRNTNEFGRITVVLLHEPKAYRLTLVFGKNARITEATTDPKVWQKVIGSMADYARFDSLTSIGQNYLTKNGSITFGFDVRP